jgi:signal peptidase I
MGRFSPVGLYRVEGHSMMPQYRPGDMLIGWRWSRRLRPGQVVIATLGRRPVLKRIGRIGPAGELWLVGDNTADSQDSRQLGPANAGDVMAHIIGRLPLQ